jgi:hypothetical protein
MDANSLANMDIVHILWGNENVLLLIGRVCGLDLTQQDWQTMAARNDCTLTIIFILIRLQAGGYQQYTTHKETTPYLFTASMKTSNSSRHLIGHPIASHNASNKQIVENDFSPPLSDLGSFSLLWVAPTPTRSSV